MFDFDTVFWCDIWLIYYVVEFGYPLELECGLLVVWVCWGFRMAASFAFVECVGLVGCHYFDSLFSWVVMFSLPV